MTRANEKVRCLSRYEPLRQLGQSNLTRSFLAARRGPAGFEAFAWLELLHEDLAKDDDFRALFLDRAARTLGLAHPQLARTEEVVADSAAAGISLRFLDGQPLSRVLARLGRNRFPVDVYLHVLSQLLAGIEHAHSGPGHGGFVHRNVCPSNVFIGYDGQIQLLGTGFADALATLERQRREPAVDIRYAAPEVLLGAPAEPAADLFSIGVLLWEAITQQARATSSDPLTIIQRRTRGAEPELESVWPDAPDALLELCGRALAREPDARHTSAGQLRAALDAYLARATEPSAVVLARLPALLDAAFATERAEQQQLLNSHRQERGSAGRRAPAGSFGDTTLELDVEDTPHDEAWSAETRVPWPPAVGAAPPSGHGASDPVAEPAAAPELGAAQAPAQPPEPARRSQLPGSFHAPLPAAPTAAPASERRDTDTGGHRAYSATLTNAPAWSLPPRRGGTLALAVLVAAALGAGGAVLHSTRRAATSQDSKGPATATGAAPARPAPPRRDETRPAISKPGAAAPATARPAAARPATHPEMAQPISARPTPAGTGRGARAAARDVGADAGVPPAELAPAFLDAQRRGSEQAAALRTLSLADLPAVDDSRDSLQRAILDAARARRLALRRKRLARPAAEPAPERREETSAPRSIDPTDPYMEPAP